MYLNLEILLLKDASHYQSFQQVVIILLVESLTLDL